MVVVLRAIQLHDQLLRHTTKVGDVWRNRVLAPELQTIQLPATQLLPELLFRIGHVAAQTARVLERGCWQRWFDCRHFARSEERRGGKECVRTCRSRGSPNN